MSTSIPNTSLKRGQSLKKKDQNSTNGPHASLDLLDSNSTTKKKIPHYKEPDKTLLKSNYEAGKKLGQ